MAIFSAHCDPSPEPKSFLKEGDEVGFGKTTFKIVFTPGHSPGSIAFYSETQKVVISGDVLFYLSIGRFDLPEANEKLLFESLTQKIMKLPDEVKVYPRPWTRNYHWV